MLYTNDEIESFNSLIHFSRAKSHVIDSLVKKYCAKGDCGSYQPNSGGPEFNIANLGEDLIPTFSWYNRILEYIQDAGDICSVVVVCYLIIILMIKLLSIA